MVNTKPRQYVILLGILACYWLAKVIFQAGIVDDTYIFLRYARNFANGYGLVFNVGEAVEGYSSPLWMFLLVLMAALTPNLISVSVLLSGLFGAATISLIFFLGQSYLPAGKKLFIVIPCLFVAFNPSFVYWTWSGMDSALFVFLFLLSFVIFLRQASTSKYLWLSGFLFFLTTLARLDMIATLPVYLIFLYFLNLHQRDTLLPKYLSFLAPLGLLTLQLIWRYFYYDDFLPNTFYAKAGIPRAILISNGLSYTFQFLLAYGLLVAIVFLAPLFLNHLGKRLHTAWYFGLAIAGAWAAYMVVIGGDHFSMFRFFLPVIVILVFLLVLLVAQIDSLAQKTPRAIMLIVFISLLPALNLFIFRYTGGSIARQEVYLAESWSEVGRWFMDNTPADSSIALGVVGAIPYYSNLKTYDLFGLTNREIAHYGNIHLSGRPGHQKYDSAYILKEKPNYIIFGFSGIFEEPLGGQDLNLSYDYAVYDLINQEQTKQLYEYQAVEMSNGRYVEFLQLK